MSESVRVETRGPVMVVTLDRPSANAIDVATSQAMYEAFREFNTNDSYRVAVVTGGGDRFFCAGWDLKAAAEGEAVDADHGPGGFAGITEYFDLAKPVIAAVNGLAIGGGFELALAADMIVAADHAEFALPEVGLGIIPDSGGVLRLPRRLPTGIAKEMLLTGRRMSAREAERWGLVNSVSPAAELMDTAVSLAETIAASAPLAVRAVQELVKETQTLDIPHAYRVLRSGDLSEYQAMLVSADAQEGSAAFAEKREPQWRGRRP